MIFKITNANRVNTNPSKICKNRPVLNSYNFFIGHGIGVSNEIKRSILDSIVASTKQNTLSEPVLLI